jgi:phosphoribosylformylglycinamidine synthase
VVHGHLGGRPPVADLPREKALAGLLAAGAHEGLFNAAHDLSDGGLAAALVEASLRFGVGVRVFLDDLLARDGVDLATALFSETGGRAIVAVPREEDVKFMRLCEGRGYPVLRIGVTDAGGADGAAVEVQGAFVLPLERLRSGYQGAMSNAFGPVVGQRP